MSGNIYIIQLATISVKVTRQASYTGIYIYIFTVLILLFVQIVLMAKRRVPVRWSPRGGRRKVCYHIALSSLKDIQGKKIINLTDARKLFFIQTAQKSRYCFKSLYPWLFARMHVNTETAHLFIDFLCMS